MSDAIVVESVVFVESSCWARNCLGLNRQDLIGDKATPRKSGNTEFGTVLARGWLDRRRGSRSKHALEIPRSGEEVRERFPSCWSDS